jgi:uncharacterized damage-inducible protein DinB
MAERDDLVASLQRQRFFLCNTLRDLTDEQAGLQSTTSELCLGGLVKHVARTEHQWAQFIRIGPAAMSMADESAVSDWMAAFWMTADDTVAGVLADYDAVAQDTDDLVRSCPDLDASQPLPEAPWFEPGARWSVRRVVLHIIAEIAQHAGHADIIRESIDGAKSMG